MSEKKMSEKPIRKKLIEVALPLEAINAASAREKSIRHGHPSTLHLWWARRPLAAARAVIFAQMVDDPSSWPELFPTVKKQDKERQRLFRIIEELVKWENTTNETVLQAAREEIWASWRRACAENADHPRAKELFDRNKLPGFHDPFAGGGGIPLEAQRLGLEAYASDLNPVAVLINKAMIEIPPKFAGRPPVNPEARANKELIGREWKGAQGLAEDVRYYGKWMRDEAEKRIGHLYPKVSVTAEMARDRPDLRQYAGQQLTVIAWLWARTVRSPNPAFASVDVPLASSFVLSTKAGREVHVEPEIFDGGYRFAVKLGKPKKSQLASNGTKLSRGANFACLMSGTPITGDYIKAEAKAGRMDARLLAIVAEAERGRVYLAPTHEHEATARSAKPAWRPDVEFFQQALGFRVGNYGMTSWGDLFTARQLVALTTLSDLVGEAIGLILRDTISSGSGDDSRRLHEQGNRATAYADAVAAYLGIGVSRLADAQNSLCQWGPGMDQTQHLFRRQAVPMVWDYAESSLFSGAAGDILTTLTTIARVVGQFQGGCEGRSLHGDAQSQRFSEDRVISTDPPYYDNIGYADLSDFFYTWLRRSLRGIFPDLFAMLAVPKAEELVATPVRHGSREEAEAFFLAGMTQAMHRLAEQTHPWFPVTIYYAFKQSESDDATGTTSTGWEAFLDAVVDAGFAATGTWPMRTEREARSRGIDSNALASSIILVCRRRSADSLATTRREFIGALRAELPAALRQLQKGNIAPVDLAQAAIGPGMAVFTRYAKVLDAEGGRVRVREALALINQTLDETLAEQEGDFDSDTRFALAWFEQHGFADGEFGVADVLARAKNTSVQGLVEAGVAESKRGKVRLLRAEELPHDWDPDTDPRLTNWEMVHHLIRVLASGGESAAATLFTKLGSRAETARELCYRLYTIAERKKRATEALAYNGLVQSWPEIARIASLGPASAPAGPTQSGLFGDTDGGDA
jgi:putative DNA methylase